MTECNKHYIGQTISSMKEGCEICYEIAKTKLEENRRVLDKMSDFTEDVYDAGYITKRTFYDFNEVITSLRLPQKEGDVR